MVIFLPLNRHLWSRKCRHQLHRESWKSVFTSSSLPETHRNNENPFHCLIIDSDIFKTILDVVCPTCQHKKRSYINNTASKKGLANFIEISGKKGNFVYFTYTSKQRIREGVRGQMPFDINARSMISFREIGNGHSAMEKVFGLMNFVPIMNFDSYIEVTADIACSYSNVARSCMMEAAEELKGSTDENLLCNVGLSCDGTWQKRGYSSLLGAVTVISVDTGKCLDYAVLSKRCVLCTSWERQKGTEDYEEFLNTIKDSHKCPVDHDGSAPAMEACGVVTCFKRLIERYGLRYTEYLGDGDSKGYKAVCEADPYNVPIKKSECSGHIQKRVGRRLRNLRDDGVFNDLNDDVVDETDASNDSKKKTKTKKSAKLRLSDKMINKLRNY